MKSTDKGKTWERIIMESESDIDFTLVKKAGNELYAYDHRNYFFISQDDGKTWNRYKFNNKSYYIGYFDANIRNEVAYTDNDITYYTNDTGKSWKMLDTTGLSNKSSYLLKIYDDGKILVHANSGNYIYDFSGYN